MAWFIRKLMVVMMDLIVLILVEVQANELSSTFFHPSSLPISLHPLELDIYHKTLYSCLDKRVTKCEEKHERSLGYFSN
jgi:hypothetical protein